MYILSLYSWILFLILGHFGIFRFKGIYIHLFLYFPLLLVVTRHSLISYNFRSLPKFFKIVTKQFILLTVFIVFLAYGTTTTNLKVLSIDTWNYFNFIVYLGVVAGISSYHSFKTFLKFSTIIILGYFAFSILFDFLSSKSLHNAYYGMISTMLLGEALRMYSQPKSFWLKLFLLSIIFISILFPILASLRGSTGFMVAALIYYSLCRGIKKLTFLLLLIFGILILFQSKFDAYISSVGRYGHESVTDIFQDYTPEEANISIRTQWWESAILDASDKIFGSLFKYTFSPFPGVVARAPMLHNMFIAVIVDCGILYGLLFLIIFLGPLFFAYKLARQGIFSSQAVWIISLFGCLVSNGYGFILTYIGISGIIYALAFVSLYYDYIRLSNKKEVSKIESCKKYPVFS